VVVVAAVAVTGQRIEWATEMETTLRDTPIPIEIETGIVKEIEIIEIEIEIGTGAGTGAETGAETEAETETGSVILIATTIITGTNLTIIPVVLLLLLLIIIIIIIILILLRRRRLLLLVVIPIIRRLLPTREKGRTSIPVRTLTKGTHNHTNAPDTNKNKNNIGKHESTFQTLTCRWQTWFVF
jgi:hypothetical protein